MANSRKDEHKLNQAQTLRKTASAGFADPGLLQALKMDQVKNSDVAPVAKTIPTKADAPRPANTGALTAQAFRAADSDNMRQNAAQRVISDPVQSQKLVASMYGMQQPTAEQLDIYKKDDESKKSAELQTKLDRINARIQTLSFTINPEYAAVNTSADIIELSDLLNKKKDIEKEKSGYDKAYAAHPAQLTESEQQAKGYKDQAKTANDKIITTIFDPSPYADYGGMVTAQK